MTTTNRDLPPRQESGPAPIVTPQVFAERLLSRESLERIQVPESDLIGLRNSLTGETLYVNEFRLQRWMQSSR